MSLSEVMQEKLKRALTARRVAIVGASQEQLSVGIGPIYNLLRMPFQGEVLPVNPKYDQLLGRKCYPDLESIDPPPDVAVILMNQHRALEMVERAARCGVAGAVIVAGGFKEVSAGGEEMEARLRELANRCQMPVIGPNTLGFSSFHHGLHSIFWHLDAFPGPVAIISQSGGVGLTMAYSLRTLHCGLSHFIGAGNRSVVDFVDYLEVLKDNSQVKTFCLFVEGLENPRELYEAARAISPLKPIVIYKAGKHEGVARATATHTGVLTGDYGLYQAMFRQAGMVEVQSTWEAAVAAKALSMLEPPPGNRLCALTFTAGPCIVAMDRLLGGGWQLSDLSPETQRKIKSIIGETTPVDIQNPIDLTGPGFLPHTYSRVLETVLDEPFDAYFLVWNYNPLIRVPLVELAEFQRRAGRPIVVVFLAHQSEAASHLQAFAARGICAYLTPEDGAIALNGLLFRRNARLDFAGSPQALPRSFPYSAQAAPVTLAEHQAKELLREAGVAVVPVATVDSLEDALREAEVLGCPVALKFASPAFTHKTEIGGVRLNLRQPSEIEEAFGHLQKLRQDLDPSAAIIVEPMVPAGVELFIGYQRHPAFGPVLTLGLGGIWLELVRDVSFRLLPATRQDFAAMLAELKSWPKLRAGFRHLPPLSDAIVVDLMERIAAFVLAHPEIAEMDLNPVTAYSDRALVVDARIVHA